MNGFAERRMFVVGKSATEGVGDGVEPEVFDIGGMFAAFDEFGFDVADGSGEFVVVGDAVGTGGGFGRRRGRKRIGCACGGGGHGLQEGGGMCVSGFGGVWGHGGGRVA